MLMPRSLAASAIADDGIEPMLVVRIISHSLASRRFAAGNVVYRTLVGYALGLLAIVLEQDNRFLQSVLLDVVGEFPQFAIDRMHFHLIPVEIGWFSVASTSARMVLKILLICSGV
jgi:hypothetical protein